MLSLLSYFALYIPIAVVGLIALLYGFQRVRKRRTLIVSQKAAGTATPCSCAHSRLLNVCIVLGSGGHTTEILRLVKELSPNMYARRHYIMAETDKMSEQKLLDFECETLAGTFTLHRIPRSREVHQSYKSSVLTTLRSIFYCLPLVYNLGVDVLLVNGPGTCIPICFWAWLLDLFLIQRCEIIFIESVCRVNTLSLTGQLLYYTPLADKCIVQWPQLQRIYKRTVFLGRL